MQERNAKCLWGFILALLLGGLPIVPIITLVVCISGIRECLPSTKNKWMGIVGAVLSILSLIVQFIVLAVVVFTVAYGVDKFNETTLNDIVIDTEAEVDSDAEETNESEGNPEIVTEEVSEEMTESEGNPEIVTEEVSEEMTEVEQADGEETTEEAADLLLTEEPTNTKRSGETLPEVGEYEAYDYWGGYRGETDNGY
mgnify:CR=1 FL=1